MAIPECKKSAIIYLYKNNDSIRTISNKTGVSQVTISKILKAAGLEIRKTNYQKLALDPVTINQLYTDGMSTYQIAAQFACSDETIRNIISSIRDTKTRNKLQPESIAKIQIASKNNWQKEEYKQKVQTATNTPEYKAKLREASTKNYETTLGSWIKTAEAKLIISKAAKEKWTDPAYFAKQSIWFQQRGNAITTASIEALKDPIKRRVWLDKIRHNNTNRNPSGWVSTSQKQLYYILSASKIIYHEEGQDTKVGPFYVVDCIIPKQQSMNKPLIIEVQGEYWHSLPHVMVKDKQKATYVRNHTDYDLLALDELRLNSWNDVTAKLSEYGLHIHTDICKPRDLTIKTITESEASMFYSIFHYTGSIRKGATVFGAYLDDELVAAISYCYPIRAESATRLGYQLKEVMEISRLARRTNLICKNLMSYLIAKTKKMLPNYIKCLISFSDSTYEHTGTTYKASGFTFDGIVEPDYSYVSITGKYHKKTIWDRAKKMKMAEKDYALKHNLIRIQGKAKARWICVL